MFFFFGAVFPYTNPSVVARRLNALLVALLTVYLKYKNDTSMQQDAKI
jgi:hypothetical protein